MTEPTEAEAAALFPDSEQMQRKWLEAKRFLYEHALGEASTSPRLTKEANETLRPPEVHLLRRGNGWAD